MGKYKPVFIDEILLSHSVEKKVHQQDVFSSFCAHGRSILKAMDFDRTITLHNAFYPPGGVWTRQ